MSNKVSYILLGIMLMILLGVDLFLLSRTVSYKKEIAIKDEVISSSSRSELLTSYFESNFVFNLKYGRAKLTDFPVFDIDGNEVSMAGAGRGPMLIFRFNEHDCMECISFGMMKLSTFTGNAAIMARYSDIHPFRRWGQTIETPDVDVYYAPSKIESDNISNPYFFVLHEDMTIGELFIPDKSLPKQTSEYLDAISQKYFNVK